MEPVLNRFSWRIFLVYSLIFLGLSILFDLVSNTFQQPDFELRKYVIGLFIRSIPISFFIAFFNNKKEYTNLRK